MNVPVELQENVDFYNKLFFKTCIPNPSVDPEGKTKLPVGNGHLCYAAYLVMNLGKVRVYEK